MANTAGVGERIKEVRQRRGITQLWLAQRIGISKQGMYAIEAGHADPRSSRVAEIARALRVSTDYLLGLKDEEELLDSIEVCAVA